MQNAPIPAPTREQLTKMRDLRDRLCVDVRAWTQSGAALTQLMSAKIEWLESLDRILARHTR